MTSTPPEEAHVPEIVIRAPRGLGLNNLIELWRYRHLVFGMVRRQVRSRYQELFLGMFWAVARPIAMTLVFVFLKHISAAKMGVTVPYPAYLFSGLITWFYFTGTLKSVANGLRRDAALVQKVYFPRLVSPVSSLLSGTIDFAIGGAIFLGILVYFGILPGWQVVMLPAVVLQLMVLTLGVGLIFAGLAIYSKDWGEFLSLILYVGLFVSPVIYSPAMVPEGVRGIYHYNPMVGVLMGVRSSFFESMPFPWADWLYSLGFSVVALIAGLYVFNYVEQRLLDRL